MIFAEDLQSGIDLLNRLKYIKANPLYKARPTYNRREDYSPATAQSIEEFVNWNLQPAEILTKRRIRHIGEVGKKQTETHKQLLLALMSIKSHFKFDLFTWRVAA